MENRLSSFYSTARRVHAILAPNDALALGIAQALASAGVIDWDATEAQASEHLRKVGLDVPAWTLVSDLGIGQQQLVEIAKALSKDVRLLILDEPTAALNDVDSAHLLDLMRSLRERGITMVLISHKLSEVVSVADRVTVIRDGKTVATAPLHGEGAIDEDEIVRLMVGRELTSRFPEHTPRIGDEVFRLSHWTVHDATDPARKTVDDVSVVLRRGEVVGLAGLVGSGRTELAMSLFGRSRGTGVSGVAYKDGKEISTSTVSRAIDAGLAYVTEDRRGLGLNLIQDIKTNTTAVALGKVSSHKVVDGPAEERVARRYKSELGIRAESIDRPVGTLSGGNLKAALLSGVNVKRVDFMLFVNMGLLAALAAIVTTSRAGAAVSSAGNLYEMDAIAAVFIGGAAVSGGVGRVSGTVAGALIMGVLNMGLSIMGVDSAWQPVIKGLVLLIAVAVDVAGKRRGRL